MMQKNFHNYSMETALKRRMLAEMLINCAQKLKVWMTEVKEKYDRRISFGSAIKEMCSSAIENELLISETEKYESDCCSWHQGIVEKQFECIRGLKVIMSSYFKRNPVNS
jgi:hypothetical protein